MKMLIREGKVIGDSNLLHFKDDNDDMTFMFNNSLNYVLDNLDGYEIDKYGGNIYKDIYYLYYFKRKVEEIKEVIGKIIENNDEDVINKSSLIMALYNYSDSSIFWDVLNSNIIVLGKDNLKVLLHELEKLRWVKRNISFKEKELEEKYINAAASNVYKKALKM